MTSAPSSATRQNPNHRGPNTATLRTLCAHHQRGGAMLVWVLGLALLAALVSAHTSKTVLTEVAAGHGLGQSQRARWAAQAALATAQAEVLGQMASASPALLFATGLQACPADATGPQWQCGTVPMPAHDAATPDWRSQAVWLRDVATAPHVIDIRASASHSGGAQASVRERMWVPTLGATAATSSGAALVLNGCTPASVASAWRICPAPAAGAPVCSGSGLASAAAVHTHGAADLDGNGTIDAAERAQCLPLSPAQLPAGGTLTSNATPSASAAPALCSRATWRSAFGEASPEQFRAWSEAQERQGLSAHSTPARSIYWIDSAATWTQSIGQPSAPVLLIFSAQACATRCPSVADGVRIYGTVYADAHCDDRKMQDWQPGWVQGQVLVEAGLPTRAGAGTVAADANARNAYALHWPAGIDARVAQRVHGSHWQGGAP